MTKFQVFLNKVSNFFKADYSLAIMAVFLFIGFAFNLEIYFVPLAIVLCVISLMYGNSVKTLLSLLVLLPVSFSPKFSFSKINIITLAFGASILFASVCYFVVVNFKQIKSQWTLGKLIGGLTFALVGMLFVGLTKTSYLANLYYLIGVCALIVVYVLSVNIRDFTFLSKLVITFAVFVSFETPLGGALLASRDILAVNILAICCLFTLGADYLSSVFSNLLSVLLCIFTIVYGNGVLALITASVYLVAVVYYVIKNPNKILVSVGALVIGLAILSACNWCSLGKIFTQISKDITGYKFNLGGLDLLSGVSVAFGLGFSSLNISFTVMIASVGVIGMLLLLVLILQATKRLTTMLTYNKLFVLFGAISLLIVSIVCRLPATILLVLMAYLALPESENFALSYAPVSSKGWGDKAKNFEQKFKSEKTFYERCLKRPFDFVISLFAIIILSPLFLILFIASKISIGGKAIFSQYRPGKNGKVFKLYKFRSMNNKTDENGNLLPDSQRLTKFGKIIRKLSVDELPQLFNILKGDMSIVGTRPRIVRDIVFYDEYALKAYSIRPGLTSLSQISGGRSTASFEDIIEKDVRYASNITFWGDVYILFRTVFVLFEGSNGEAVEGGRKDYWYCNYLLHSGKITQKQYNQGLKVAEEIIKTKGTVGYNKQLHND